jgi:hypothetical protein
MKKYNIEGGIDFFNELYKSLDIDENEHKTEEDANLCLITNQLLVDKFVEMSCGHKFNYIPLYHDIKNHKQKFNNMEGATGRLCQNEIRCPYCRKKQKNILPYYEELGLPKINGVNAFDQNYKPGLYNSSGQSYTLCQFSNPNTVYDTSGNVTTVFIKCFQVGSKINCIDKTGITETNFGDEKKYCYTHKKQMIKNYKKDISDKAKEDTKIAKIKAKEELIKAKEELKKAKEEEKQKMKKELKKTVMEAKQNKLTNIPSLTNIPNITNLTNINNINNNNTIIGSIDIIENNIKQYCDVILKTGPNKGNPCGCKVKINNLCQRHYK